ncbi:MAG: DEAD/DEAH box helicase family protein [Chloroflexota bacterium]
MQRDLRIDTFTSLSFQHPFRKYQRMILAQVEGNPDAQTYHIVAPPGSGKTIVGLEMIRRFGEPAVVFAPTTTIQQQWQEKVHLFTDDPEYTTSLVSQNPLELALINIFTYQLISTPGQASENKRHIALQQWIDDLLSDGQVSDTAAARTRIETLQQNNPRHYEREIAQRYRRIKRELLRKDDVDVAHFLHPNARALIERLVAYGVKTIVLDECHHLLDYWAIVLRYLIRCIDNPRVIGLTATLPSLDDGDEYENYTSLLGDVDFEVPTPAVVKEGDLAPYRDLVYFVEPSKRELSYLENIQEAFETTTNDITNSERFHNWLISTILERPEDDGTTIPWETFLYNQPLVSIAGLRFLHRIKHPIPSDIIIPTEAHEDLTLDDWLVLLERYAFDELKLSADFDDHHQLAQLRRILLPFGLTLTERGLRQGRSAGDLVLALSEAKDVAVSEILEAEDKHMGERLRAVVVTDFERMSSGVQRNLKDVMDADAGSALRVFRHLVTDDATGHLDPILVTGKTVMVDADHGQELLDHFNAYLKQQGLQATCTYRETDIPYILEVVGEGRDWSSRTYVRMITKVFEQGKTRCLVGTRGIFGEGWDSLSLNTLIDLTSVTTSTSVQQLRGRSIRLDPRWQRKVAHNWDVICVAPTFERGNADLRRFERRHGHYWGVLSVSEWDQSLGDALQVLSGKTLGGQTRSAIVKGVLHVDADLAYDMATKKFARIPFGKYTKAMLRQIPQRDRVYDMWGIGDEYSNFTYTATRLQADDLKIRTVFTIEQTIKRVLREFRATLLASILSVSYLLFYLLFRSVTPNINATPITLLTIIGIGFVIGLLVVIGINARGAYQIGRTLLLEQPPDAILLDVGRALLASLKETGLVSRNLQPDYVRVIEQTDNSYQVLLDYASPEDATTFVTAYRQIFAPVRDQRYLVMRDDTRLPHVTFQSVWVVVHQWFQQTSLYKPAYHPVPDVLATRRERADAFAQYWKHYVGGGKLVFTRSETGRQVLLEARSQQRPKAPSLAFEIWR